ncbi:MAG: FprA family A-type flavoprotein [Candidatus Omnitrophica bacterium]|nr:FprA family A-type flavoprotein [Candidatus Omnitrophota bacterium]
MEKITIGKGIYWVGVTDWNLREFHGYRTGRGSTYNSYLILDEKKCVVDTVKTPFTSEFIAKIKELTSLEDIDYIISNHLELDHAGAVAELAKVCPRAKILATGQWIEGAKKYFGPNLPVQQVRTGDKIPLGKNTLTFIEAPMLHWPDSMFTYLPEQEILMPNDAFGQHYATSQIFNDQVPEEILMEEALRYFATILQPLSPLILKMLDKIAGLKLKFKVIAPSHGVIWRNAPEKIIAAYQRWSEGEANREAVVVYDTMWGSTEIIGRKIAEGIMKENLPVSVLSLKENEPGDIITAIFKAKAVALGAPALNNLPFPEMVKLFTFLKGLKPKNKIWALFGSYGWNKGILPQFGEEIKAAGFPMPLPVFETRFRPGPEEEKAAQEFGQALAKLINNKQE